MQLAARLLLVLLPLGATGAQAADRVLGMYVPLHADASRCKALNLGGCDTQAFIGTVASMEPDGRCRLLTRYLGGPGPQDSAVVWVPMVLEQAVTVRCEAKGECPCEP